MNRPCLVSFVFFCVFFAHIICCFFLFFFCFGLLLLDKGSTDYWYINQAETTIAGVDDKEEFAMTDVRRHLNDCANANHMMYRRFLFFCSLSRTRCSTSIVSACCFVFWV